LKESLKKTIEVVVSVLVFGNEAVDGKFVPETELKGGCSNGRKEEVCTFHQDHVVRAAQITNMHKILRW
jgi:hypothetical protein